ncbi:MAG: DJ-1/PfpI family protein [Parvibaculaceae bacterium]|nr:DJ-1/PfpI family protein [Parvibaculaceae bacterium]
MSDLQKKIGILIFNGVEELDFVGPFEVFSMSNEVFGYEGKTAPDQITLISQNGQPIVGAKGMKFTPDASIDDIGALDVLLIPGGQGTRTEMHNKPLLEWVEKMAAQATWVTSVCTGALLYAAIGLTKGKKVTTHWGALDLLAKVDDNATVLSNRRYVRDGNLVTSAGVSAGIDMALWLTGQRYTPDHARNTQHAMEYNPAPPYSADV